LNDGVQCEGRRNRDEGNVEDFGRHPVGSQLGDWGG
jgi:hypothetical protein